MEGKPQPIMHFKNLSLENIEGEIWKDIPGYEGAYQTSNFGRVKSLTRTIDGHKSTYIKNGRILKQKKDKYGYRVLNLSGEHANSKRRKFITVHRLVCMAFLANDFNHPSINHKNGIKDDNTVENLEWCTIAHNNKHGYQTGLKKATKYWTGKKGKDNAHSKPIFQYDLQGNFIKKFDSVRIAATAVGGTQPTISKYILRRRNKKCKTKKNNVYGYHWDFK